MDKLTMPLTSSEVFHLVRYYGRNGLHMKDYNLWGKTPMEVASMFGITPEEVASAAGRG